MAQNGVAKQQEQANTPNVWTEMGYVPPRGPCAQKLSMISSCPCFRFMLNPLKGPTSFECDGCGHHASFHRMDNKEDDKSVGYWKEVQNDSDTKRALTVKRYGLGPAQAGTPAPTRRRIDSAPVDGSDDGLEPVDEVVDLSRHAAKRKRTEGR
ncbi:MAG: hypothetical protein L6R39_000327 [Caloplaca ligustica]|nr:MAG: hypothetical protein L6R39_000327 [Caloplaca ligustica]